MTSDRSMLGDEFAGALLQKLLRDELAERVGIVAAGLAAYRAAILGRADLADQVQAAFDVVRERRDRHLAAAVQRAVHRALGLDAGAGLALIHI